MDFEGAGESSLAGCIVERTVQPLERLHGSGNQGLKLSRIGTVSLDEKTVALCGRWMVMEQVSEYLGSCPGEIDSMF